MLVRSGHSALALTDAASAVGLVTMMSALAFDTGRGRIVACEGC